MKILTDKKSFYWFKNANGDVLNPNKWATSKFISEQFFMEEISVHEYEGLVPSNTSFNIPFVEQLFGVSGLVEFNFTVNYYVEIE